MSLISKIASGVVAVLLIVWIGVAFRNETVDTTVGSVAIGNEYQSVMTGTQGAIATAGGLIKSGSGTFGSVVITGVGVGTLEFYDASTTNVNLRANATSSLRKLASFGPSVAAGTYTFDSNFFDGLAVGISGVQPSTTITYR